MEKEVIYISSFILCFVISIFILAVLFLRRGAGRLDRFGKLYSKRGFKPLDGNSYILRTNRFADIITNDFLGDQNLESVDIKSGVMKYSVSESIFLCNCIFNYKYSQDAGPRAFGALVLVHLCQLPVAQVLKIRRKSSGHKEMIFYQNDFACDLSDQEDEVSDIFSFSSREPFDFSMLRRELKDSLMKSKDKFPFGRAKFKGVIAIAPKGWIILAADFINSYAIDSVLDLDKSIHDSFKP